MDVTLCGNCQGQGSFLINERDGYEQHECKKCKGTGRVLKRTYTVEMPYGTKTEEYLDVDRQITELIRNINKNNL